MPTHHFDAGRQGEEFRKAVYDDIRKNIEADAYRMIAGGKPPVDPREKERELEPIDLVRVDGVWRKR